MDILLVEDSDEVRAITVEYLKELGHEVLAVEDAEGAIAHCAERGFDTVLTDVSLPGMSGIALAKELTKKYPKLPIVISSGYGAMNLEFLLGEKLPNVLMLPKPYDMTMLERILTEAAVIRRS
jgi:CheY-like chemotaxis protein